MQLSARGAQRTRDESKKLNMYSKQWLPGDTLRVFYPIFWDEDNTAQIAVGAVWGHNVSDIKALGLHTAFIPSTTDFDENAQPIGQPDVTYQFSQIARVFVNGQKAIEEANIQSKTWPNEAGLKEALRDLENKYDAKNNRNAVRPIIGRAQYYISTEVLSVKIANGVPVKDSLVLSSAPLSNQTIRRLYTIIDDPKYGPQPGDNFLEVEWKYPAGTDKGESGRQAAPAGLTPEYRMEAQFPDTYAAVKGMMSQVATDSETIVRRATRTVDPNKVRQALTQYTFLNSEALDAASEEDAEVLCKHADLIHELDAVRSLKRQDLIESINKAIADMQVTRPNVPEQIPTPEPAAVPPVPEQAAAAPIPPTMPEDVKAADDALAKLQTVSGAPTMASLLNNINNASGEDSGDIEAVDFSAAP